MVPLLAELHGHGRKPTLFIRLKVSLPGSSVSSLVFNPVLPNGNRGICLKFVLSKEMGSGKFLTSLPWKS